MCTGYINQGYKIASQYIIKQALPQDLYDLTKTTQRWITLKTLNHIHLRKTYHEMELEYTNCEILKNCYYSFAFKAWPINVWNLSTDTNTKVENCKTKNLVAFTI